MRRRLFVALLLFFSCPAAASASEPVAWLVPGGGALWIPNELGVEPNRPMFGGLLGIRLGSAWALEVRGVFATSDVDTTSPFAPSASLTQDLLHADASLTLFLRSDGIRPYLTTGAGVVRFTGALDKTRFAWSGGLGFYVPFTERLGLRVDGREVMYEVFVPSKGEDRFKHGPEAFAGLAFGFGGAAKDADRDGVRDKLDRCPRTPVGARVDAAGCPIDGDEDGVPDGLDRCDATPRGAAADERGCPQDLDQDGVFDGLDACPDTPRGARVSATGCPSDSDKDGIPDGLDQCEGTPERCEVNPNGCPTDADQDGVCDGIDRCPDSPSNARVDATGCPIEISTKETELLETGMIRLQDVNFDTGKATIKPESFRTLDEVGDILARWADLRIEIAGHTDSRGTDAMNLRLSEARARAVRDYLLHKFPELRPEQFTAKGYGEHQPVATNTTALGRARNRRVEFRVMNKEALKRETEKRGFAPKE